MQDYIKEFWTTDMHLGLTCPFCLNQEIEEHPEIDDYGRYVCGHCGAEFAVAQQVSPDEIQFWDKASENRDYDVERVKDEVAEKLAEKIDPTTTPTYGSGEIWAAYHRWARETEE